MNSIALKKAIERAKADLRTHFKRDGWDLDVFAYYVEIVNDAAGFDTSAPILCMFDEVADVKVGTGDEAWKLKKRNSSGTRSNGKSRSSKTGRTRSGRKAKK